MSFYLPSMQRVRDWTLFSSDKKFSRNHRVSQEGSVPIIPSLLVVTRKVLYLDTQGTETVSF